MHKCIICNNKSKYVFSKNFNLKTLKKADYFKCTSCGFMISKTHEDMDEDTWKKLNTEFHLEFLGKLDSKIDPKWISRLNAQKELIKNLIKTEVVNKYDNWVDFGCGDGKLSNMLYNVVKINKFDRYCSIIDEHDYCGKIAFLSEQDFKSKDFDIVINTSVLEHLRKREDINEIISLPKKCLLLHTLICENIPETPEWFYLLPGHCSFFTNKSMQILFDEFGYKYSFYDIKSSMWGLFKNKPNSIETVDKFLDYWKL